MIAIVIVEEGAREAGWAFLYNCPAAAESEITGGEGIRSEVCCGSSSISSHLHREPIELVVWLL